MKKQKVLKNINKASTKNFKIDDDISHRRIGRYRQSEIIRESKLNTPSFDSDSIPNINIQNTSNKDQEDVSDFN